MTSGGGGASSSGDSHRIAYGVVVINEHNEVLLLRSLDPRIGQRDKWIVPMGWVEGGREIVPEIRKCVKDDTMVEIEMDGTMEPFEKISLVRGTPANQQVLLGFLARSQSDIRELGPMVQTAGWFTPQEVRWYWEKIAEESRRLLVGSNYIVETD